ncbi:RNA-binding protein 33-like isoform X1 [Photinus pyralis]|uniref:RNA-binding protein 33-like isoform X1 n=1 Tax=Photinus pyralis TaxID=7054 RepID=UPI0012675858|nr:RNA-binding protein 33-like isoform X1 [Photinus pyralis]
MMDTDSDALLLDKIGGKYGEEGSEYGDLANADEDALLADDELLLDQDSDTLVLEASEDVELEDLEDKNSSAQPVTSTTKPEADLSILNSSEQEDREREDRFKSERQIPSSRSSNIPDSLDKVQVVSSLPTARNGKRGMGTFRQRGRGGSYSNRNAQNQTVLINPHFKGHVKINNNTRLAWDARHKTNNNHQVGRIMPFSQNRKQNQNVNNIQPWIQTYQPMTVPQNVPQFQQPPPQVPVFQQNIHPPQVNAWNQYQPNSFNEVPQQMMMQQPPQNMFTNQQMPPQFNQPPPQFGGPQYPPPIYSGPVQNTSFCNNQFLTPPNQFRPSDQVYPTFPQVQQNQYMQNARGPPQYNPPANEFNNNRIIRPKQSFTHAAKNYKRKIENAETRKKKRNLASTNLHEVRTIETPDTTVKEEKVEEEEDEYTREYKLHIEEQKRKREQILKLKEERRLKSIQEGKSGNLKDDVEKMVTEQQNPPILKQQYSNLKEVRLGPKVTNSPKIQQTVIRPQTFNNNINTDSNYDKQHLASFLSNRRILTKDQSLIDTSIVVISNLAAGTTDVRLRKMCQGIGDIKKLQMSPMERQATIQFNSVASAHAFFKKYQRTMLDLSMIQVTLKPVS